MKCQANNRLIPVLSDLLFGAAHVGAAPELDIACCGIHPCFEHAAVHAARQFEQPGEGALYHGLKGAYFVGQSRFLDKGNHAVHHRIGFFLVSKAHRQTLNGHSRGYSININFYIYSFI